MSRLQRSSVSFRRQGSSGRIWDDPLRTLDLKGPSSAPTTPRAVPADPFSPRAEPSSARSWRGQAPAAAVIAESPASADRSPGASSVVVHGGEDGGARSERPARRRRRLSKAFCACMGHPPASHAQQ
ncbi:hypothetical protein PR202_ga28005 [Eleusine coracana subsp. coracana]|uniref:Uncharacterized protein n=1 Tax=Eleusine coracana subsp. coracana TaxID=191504 RepID=A0AAV5DHZ4_ELECO|nr:hypothetical protein PR202_ga28005 [Eleusine coracana subsp. coracana]